MPADSIDRIPKPAGELFKIPGIPDGLDGLPDVTPDPDGGGPEFDPVMELHKLTTETAERLNALTAQGVNLQDGHTMVTALIQSALLEEILRTIGGEGAVTRALLTIHQQIADMLTDAEGQVRRAKLASPGGLPPQMGNGNRAARRGH